jgi:hypothetical protein
MASLFYPNQTAFKEFFNDLYNLNFTGWEKRQCSWNKDNTDHPEERCKSFYDNLGDEFMENKRFKAFIIDQFNKDPKREQVKQLVLTTKFETQMLRSIIGKTNDKHVDAIRFQIAYGMFTIIKEYLKQEQIKEQQQLPGQGGKIKSRKTRKSKKMRKTRKSKKMRKTRKSRKTRKFSKK